MFSFLAPRGARRLFRGPLFTKCLKLRACAVRPARPPARLRKCRKRALGPEGKIALGGAGRAFARRPARLRALESEKPRKCKYFENIQCFASSAPSLARRRKKTSPAREKRGAALGPARGQRWTILGKNSSRPKTNKLIRGELFFPAALCFKQGAEIRPRALRPEGAPGLMAVHGGLIATK